jgi:hypothetical protein
MLNDMNSSSGIEINAEGTNFVLFSCVLFFGYLACLMTLFSWKIMIHVSGWLDENYEKPSSVRMSVTGWDTEPGDFFCASTIGKRQTDYGVIIQFSSIFSLCTCCSSSVSIVSDYRLQRQRIFSSSLCVHTGAEAHPASFPMGTGGPFPGEARPGLDADHSPPSRTKVKNEELYASSPWRLHGSSRTALLHFYL